MLIPGAGPLPLTAVLLGPAPRGQARCDLRWLCTCLVACVATLAAVLCWNATPWGGGAVSAHDESGLAASGASASAAGDRDPGSSARPPGAPVPVGGSSGDGTSPAPDRDLPGWRLLLSEDFERSAAPGRFAETYPGWAGYDGWRDTSRSLGRPETSQGRYDSGTTTSVHDGVADVRVHTAGSTPQVMAFTPPLPAYPGNDMTHGRYALRFRADPAPGYKIACLLWPASDDWSEGEVDFPEGELGEEVMGYAHDTGGDPARNAWEIDTGRSMSDWHTAFIEWAPGVLTYGLDGRTWTTTDPRAVPTQPMHWVLQIETRLSAAPPDPTVVGHVLVDWVAVWSRS